MSLVKKLQIQEGVKIRLVDAPDGLDLSELPSTRSATASAIMVFVLDAKALEKREKSIVGAASEDRLTWVAYPKAGQLGTDLNRDKLAALLTGKGVRPVRQISLDDVWSALRYRPA